MEIDWDTYELQINEGFTYDDLANAIDECVEMFTHYDEMGRSSPIELDDLFYELTEMEREILVEH